MRISTLACLVQKLLKTVNSPLLPGPNPAGCRQQGCPDGQICGIGDTCIPSFCECDPDLGQWVCTEDCGGGPRVGGC